MVEKNPWWKNVDGPFPSWDGKALGVKEDGEGYWRRVLSVLVNEPGLIRRGRARGPGTHRQDGHPPCCLQP